MLQEDLIDVMRGMTNQFNKLGQLFAQPTIQNPVQKNGFFHNESNKLSLTPLVEEANQFGTPKLVLFPIQAYPQWSWCNLSQPIPYRANKSFLCPTTEWTPMHVSNLSEE